MSYKLASLLFLCYAFGSLQSINALNSDDLIQDDENHYSRNLLITAPIASLISQRAQSNDKSIANKLETEFMSWLTKPAGQDAMQFCKQFRNKLDIYQGCLEDIKVTGSKDIALQGALAEEEFRSKSKMSTSRKFCVASGDPHFTNYDGDYFHLQEKGIYTLMSADGFEVQEKVRKNGQDKVGVPSCLTGLAVKYNGIITVEVNAENVRQVIVNGISVDLPRDFTMKTGGLEVRYGKQTVEWRGAKSTALGTKIVAPNGFGVMVMGGYCGVVEINVPQNYFNNVSGICGNADNKRDVNDYKNPDGQLMNVNRGARNWEMSGYYGPTTPLSKWQLAWKPLGSDCFFQTGCEPATSTRTLTSARRVSSPPSRAGPKPAPAPAPKPAPKPAPAPAPKAAPAPAPKPAPKVAPKPAPAPAPKAAPAPAPKPAPKVAPKPARKPAPKPAPAPAPAPKAAPKPAPKPAPKVAPKPAPAPAPKAAPKPAPAPAPAPAPKAAPAPAPKPAPKVAPKPAPAPAPKPAPKVAPVPSPKVAPVVSSPKSPSKGDLIDYPIKLTCDNNFKLYVNGKFVGSGDNWRKVYSFTPKVQLGVDTIAIEGHDVGGPAAFIGIFNNINSKPSNWVCKEFQNSVPTSNWNLNNFDDSNWKLPVSYGKNSDKNTIWYNVNGGSLSALSGDAQWLWTNNYDNHDHVYCRMNQATLKERTTPIVSPSPSKDKSETVKVSPSPSKDKTETVKVSPSPSKDKTETVKVSPSPSKDKTETKKSGSSESSSSSSWFKSWFSSEPSKSTPLPSEKQSVNTNIKHQPGFATKPIHEPFVFDKTGLTSPSSKKISNMTHHLNLKNAHHNELIKNLMVLRTVSNSTKACIASNLYVRYDGKGSVYIAGTDLNNKVHTNRQDCKGNIEGLQKVIQFNHNDVSYFSIDVESLFEGHLDCGGSAFWNAQKQREFTQKCSWNSFGAKNPIVVTKVTLYTTPVAVEKVEEILRNDLMGQWYLLANHKNNNKNSRQCLIATIFRHDSNFYMKHSYNKGKQTYVIKDHPIQSFAIDKQLFKMDGQVYSYKLVEFKTPKGSEHILHLKNVNNEKDDRIFGDKIYTRNAIEKILKLKYNKLSPIEQKCYTD
jgi:hypothetical protein